MFLPLWDENPALQRCGSEQEELGYSLIGHQSCVYSAHDELEKKTQHSFFVCHDSLRQVLLKA
jgi:hypothetical protein